MKAPQSKYKKSSGGQRTLNVTTYSIRTAS
jgi:hypothetical protein